LDGYKLAISRFIHLVGEQRGYEYLTFDDDVQKSVAQSDPVGFVASLPEKVILDEVLLLP